MLMILYSDSLGFLIYLDLNNSSISLAFKISYLTSYTSGDIFCNDFLSILASLLTKI